MNTIKSILAACIGICMLVACGNQTKTDDNQGSADVQSTTDYDENDFWWMYYDDDYTPGFLKERTEGDFTTVLNERRDEYIRRHPELDSLYKNNANECTKLDLCLICNAPDIWWWRLNQVSPIEKNAKSKAVEVQMAIELLDSIYTPAYCEGQSFMNMEAGTYATLQEKLMQYYWHKIVSNSPIKSVLLQEEKAWKAYVDAFSLSLDSTRIGRFHYTSASMERSGWNSFFYQERFQSFICLYNQQHQFEKIVPNSLIDSLNNVRISRVVQNNNDDYTNYPGEDTTRAILNAEQMAWNNWLKARTAVSKRLAGDVKQAYDKATNEIKYNRAMILIGVIDYRIGPGDDMEQTRLDSIKVESLIQNRPH